MQHQARRAAGKAPHKFDIGKLLCAQDARCAYCNKPLHDAYHIDHKQPIAKGGTNELSNLHLTCPRCNMRKGAMTHEEFLTSNHKNK
jgi:5-methylcytosine-specific restriction endonuclease McrA